MDAELIQTWIHCEFGRSFTLRGVSKLLVRLGFNYTKATYTLDFP
ncbi:helix-turn-helix domain-containing protein [Paenibacillus herberti]|nr:winged helix-turn-helix domain-containing protein [Paenibacillus herberti]